MRSNLGSRGFTLIETLVALVITVGAAMIVSNSWSGNNLRVRKAALYNNVASLLEKKMVEMEAKHKGKKIAEISEESGDFGEDYPQYRWVFSVQPFEMPDMSPLLSNEEDNKGADPMVLSVLKTMQETVAKSILEATVTVFVKSGEKELPFSITSYFVDYEADLLPPGGG